MRKTRTMSTAVLLLAGMIALHGCAALVAVAVVKRVVEGPRHTAKVDLDKSPEMVYGSIVRVVERTPGMVITHRYASDYSIEATKGKDNVQARANRLSGGETELIVTARSREETDVTDKDLALRTVEDICKDLGVKYEVK